MNESFRIDADAAAEWAAADEAAIAAMFDEADYVEFAAERAAHEAAIARYGREAY